MSACMFAVMRCNLWERKVTLEGVFPYRSIAEAYAKNLPDQSQHHTKIKALPFDSYADGYLPADDQRD